MNTDIRVIQEKVKTMSEPLSRIGMEIGRIVVGQHYLVERLLVGLLADGHVLLEGVPGLAKTLSVKALSGALNTQFRRVQFTPDLLPADLVGTLVYNPKEGNFSTKKGPIFANVILADEINRAPAKVQSALLEAMQERQVTLGEETHPLPKPFLVLATQNPIEQEGTYPLPEAQVDRFMLKINVGYPTRKEELQILDRMAHIGNAIKTKSVLEISEIFAMREVVNDIYLDDKIKEYIVDIVLATRDPKAYKLDLEQFIQYGASPRATIYLTLAAKAFAFLQGRGYVVPQDVKSIGMDVLRHRVIVTYEAEAEEIDSQKIVQKIFDSIPVP